MLRDAFLWIHVICGASWIAVSLSLVLAGAATPESERPAFVGRIARRFNRLNLAAVVVLPLSGIANLLFVAREHQFILPRPFLEVLAAKVALFCAMAAALALAWGTAARIGQASPARAGERRLLWLYGAMAAMGAAALMLGLWLAGSA